MVDNVIGRLRLMLIILAASASAILFAAAFPDAILAGDALNYRDRMAELFSGKAPYVQFPFEHLPVMIFPMAAAWLLGGSEQLRTFAFALAGVSTVLLVGTGLMLRRVEAGFGITGLTVRWVLLTTPILPFLLFRNDAWVVFLTVGGILLVFRGRELASLLVLSLAAMAKVWPGLWAPVEWRRGKRVAAVALLVATLASIAVVLSPALREAQNPKGLHTETVGGSLIGLGRSIEGHDLGLERSTAVYIDAPGWLLAVNFLVGGLVALSAVRGLRAPFQWTRSWRLMGALTVALIVSSPLFSTQYVAWVSPFAAVDKRTTALMFPVSAISLVLLTTWHSLSEGAVWWWGLLVLRNALFILLGLYLGWSALPRASRMLRDGRSNPSTEKGI